LLSRTAVATVATAEAEYVRARDELESRRAELKREA
jgi:hypothetical protein